VRDLDIIKADNLTRRSKKIGLTHTPWTIYKGIWSLPDREFIAFARSDNAEDVIDELVAEVERLEAVRMELARGDGPR
jgi:hypothetical protein